MKKTLSYRIDNMELRATQHVALVIKEGCGECVLKEDEGGSRYLEIVKWDTSIDKATNEIHEFCYTVALFRYDRDGYPELSFVGDRPLDLTHGEFKNFMSLVSEGYKYGRAKNNIDFVKMNKKEEFWNE